jgi:hypothetical protein
MTMAASVSAMRISMSFRSRDGRGSECNFTVSP